MLSPFSLPTSYPNHRQLQNETQIQLVNIQLHSVVQNVPIEGGSQALVIQNKAEVLVSGPGCILQLSQSCKEKSSII